MLRGVVELFCNASLYFLLSGFVVLEQRAEGLL